MRKDWEEILELIANTSNELQVKCGQTLEFSLWKFQVKCTCFSVKFIEVSGKFWDMLNNFGNRFGKI